ncbi:hypothetical protein [Amycolatopsis sp. FDAARGOS 1241]|uniref:hypothetical protein n=1 Tax=Amycolatopsis sp. FDAARGOS 1241 TaxID=2778070 RepID=UPI001EF39693|nr:hypothetical protein [Amycolatopsis sp. FDAARGOS 1241]
MPGRPELPQPPVLARRGGCWFRVPGVGGLDGELHVGVEADFRPAAKAHPAFVVDVDATARALAAAGYDVVGADPAETPGRRRFRTFDAVGNRLGAAGLALLVALFVADELYRLVILRYPGQGLALLVVAGGLLTFLGRRSWRPAVATLPLVGRGAGGYALPGFVLGASA